MWGKTPSSIPTRKTAGNSRPLAMCMVMSETRVPSPSELVGVGHQRRRLQELGQCPVLVGHADQFVHVLHPAERLDGPLGQELAAVAGALDDGGHQLARPQHGTAAAPSSSASAVTATVPSGTGVRGGPGVRPGPGHHRSRRPGRARPSCCATRPAGPPGPRAPSRLAADPGLAGLGHRLAEGDPTLAGESGQLGHRRVPHAPFGDVDDAPPAHLVVRDSPGPAGRRGRP